MKPTRRNFLALLAAAFIADPERTLWVPGAKKIFLPPEKPKIWTPNLEEINRIIKMMVDKHFADNLFNASPIYEQLMKSGHFRIDRI